MADPDDPGSIQRRVRCRDVETETTPSGLCRVRVILEWKGGRVLHGRKEDHVVPEGRMRAGAEATLAALGLLGGDAPAFALRGIKAVRAFDALIVIAAVRCEEPDRVRTLIGSAAAPGEDLVHGAALAVLNAVNRILERGSPASEPDSERPS